SPTQPWPKVMVDSYQATIDFDAEAMRVDLTRGGTGFFGPPRTIQVVAGMYAWDEVVPAAPAGGARGRGGAAGGAQGAGRGAAPAEAGRVTLAEVNSLVG